MTVHADLSPRAVVERFLLANKRLDVDAMFAEIATDAVWVFPTAPTGAPDQVVGKDANREFFDSLRPMWTSFDLKYIEIHPLADDDERVVAQYASTGELLDGSAYSNTYLSLVTVRRGAIVRWVEFCHPAPLERGVAVMLAQREAGTTP